MTDLVVLLLVVLWIAVLTPRVVRHFREGTEQSSIDDFHQQLHLLERTGPKFVEPAYKLTGGDDEVGETAALSPAMRTGLVLLDLDVVEGTRSRPMGRTTGRRPAAASRRARRRRRDVLLGAVATAVLTGVLGAMHALHLLWAVTGVAVLAIAAYVALAAYAQMLHADRRAARPVVPVPAPVHEPAWLRDRPRHAAGTPRPGIELLSSASPVAVRSSGSGEWRGGLVTRPRHAAVAR